MWFKAERRNRLLYRSRPNNRLFYRPLLHNLPDVFSSFGAVMKATITAGTVMARCPKCKEPFIGKFDADEEEFSLECVNCNHKEDFKYTWPDDLPVFKFKKRKLLKVKAKKKGGDE